MATIEAMLLWFAAYAYHNLDGQMLPDGATAVPIHIRIYIEGMCRYSFSEQIRQDLSDDLSYHPGNFLFDSESAEAFREEKSTITRRMLDQQWPDRSCY